MDPGSARRYPVERDTPPKWTLTSCTLNRAVPVRRGGRHRRAPPVADQRRVESWLLGVAVRTSGRGATPFNAARHTDGDQVAEAGAALRPARPADTG